MLRSEKMSKKDCCEKSRTTSKDSPISLKKSTRVNAGNNYKIIKKYRYEKFKLYFRELEGLLPYTKGSKNTQKTILLNTVAYIKALEIELGLIKQNVDWEKHYDKLMMCLDQNEDDDEDDVTLDDGDVEDDSWKMKKNL